MLTFQLHSTGMLSPRLGAGLQAIDGTARSVPHNLVLSRILPICSLVTPCTGLARIFKTGHGATGDFHYGLLDNSSATKTRVKRD